MSINPLNLSTLKDTVQDSNLNFLVGSGLSMPFLAMLGNIEELLTELDKSDLDESKKKIIRAALYRRYCEEVIFKNMEILEGSTGAREVLENYKNFLKIVNSILLKRKESIVNKQANIFTTNVDIYFERALEELGLEYSDGFNGRFLPLFDLSNFRKSIFKKSTHYDNKSEIPVFNLFKLHGSLTWAIHEVGKEKKIRFSPGLDHIRKLKELNFTEVAAATEGQTLADLTAATTGRRASPSVASFLESYQELPIINPTKDKFKLTLLNQYHYEMLRMYANELEKECSLLFVMGFSFADEHIRDVTLRAVNSNPTLTVYVVAHSAKAKAHFESLLGIENLRNKNIKVVAPDLTKEKTPKDEFAYDFPNINSRIFEELLKIVDEKNSRS